MKNCVCFMARVEQILKTAFFTALLFCTCCFFDLHFAPKTQIGFADEVHNHCFCSSLSCEYENLHDENISWTAYNKNNRLPSAPGNYYLTTNVTTAEWIIDSNVNLCLNGFNVTITETEIEVKENAILTITDCKNAGSINGNNTGILVYGTFNLYGGTINRPNLLRHTIINSGKLNVYCGTILSHGDGKCSIETSRIGLTNVYGGMIDSLYSLESDSERIVISGGYFRIKPTFVSLLTNRYFVQNTDSQTKNEYPFAVIYHEHEYGEFLCDDMYHYRQCVIEDCPDIESSVKEKNEHSFKMNSNKVEHWLECLTCGKTKQKQVHYGGESTCEKLAKCEICYNYYGELAEHVPGQDDGDCTTNITCKICGTETTPSKPNHEGGSATCTKRAVCEECGMEYGDLSPEHIPIEDDGDCLTAVTCSLCGVTLVEAKSGHSFSNNLDVDCNNPNCSYTRTLVIVKIPTCEKEVYEYTGYDVTFLLELSQNYVVCNNVQSEEGVYQVVVSLVKGKNLVWEDGTTHDLIFRFEIKKTKTPSNTESGNENYTWLYITAPSVLISTVVLIVIRKNMNKNNKKHGTKKKKSKINKK